MNRARFKRYGVIVFLVFALFAGGAGVHALASSPEAKGRNAMELQKIDKTQQEFSFAVFGDNRDSGGTFNILLDRLNTEHPLFGIDVGDLVGSGTKEQYDIFLREIDTLHLPLLTAIGNHDAVGNGRSFYQEAFGKFYYSFSVGESYFIVLDASEKKDFDAAQMTWLESELKKSQAYKNRFVFMHIPLYDPRSGEYQSGHSLASTEFAQKLNRLFDENKVTMLFASHIHGYFTGSWGKTPYIITGGAGAGLYGISDDHYFHHFVLVRVGKEGIRYDTVKVEIPRPASADDK